MEELIQDQLEGEDKLLICNSSLLLGIKIDKDRDCNQIADALAKRFPESFSPSNLEAYVNNLNLKTWD